MASPHRKRPIRQVAVVHFLDLPEEVQTDIAVCMKQRLERVYNIEDAGAIWMDDLRELLIQLNPKLPLVMVETWLLVQTDRTLHEDKIIEYMIVWESGKAKFPPVVIDSDSDEVLCEGGHRAFSAFQSEIKEIEAVDVAALDAAFVMKSLPKAYQVSLTQEAERQYVDLNKGVQRKVDEILDRLRDWPQVSGVVALWGDAKGHYRMKTMDWRVIFHVDEGAKIVVIDSISHRKDAYGQFHGQSRKG